MGFYIKGMEMPADHPLWIIVHSDGTVEVNKISQSRFVGWQTLRNAAVPVPPHDGKAFEKVISERITQIEKWGKEPCKHPFEWMSILGEEFGELCEAVNETCFMNGKHPERGGDENIIREATQIAAVAIAIIRDFSKTIIPAEEGEA